MEFTSAQVTGFIGGFLWPFMRIGAMLMVAPVFGARTITPARVRIGIALAMTWVVYPLLPPPPAVDPLSWDGLMVSANQILLGIAMGFVLQLVFSALVVAGQSIAMTMGLGFAQFVDPNGVQMAVVSQFYTIIGTLLFLALNGHLVALQVLLESFRSLPVGVVGASTEGLMQLVLWGGRMFAGALLIALPAIVSITLINIGFGVMTRAAPQLNIFGVLFPTTMAAGYVIIFITLPSLLPRFTDLVMDGFSLIEQMLASGA